MQDRVRYVWTVFVWLVLVLATTPRGLWGQPQPVNAVTSSVAADEKNPDLMDALARFRNKDFTGAQEMLKEAVSNGKDLPPTQLILAEWFTQANQTQAARVALERAVLEEPADPEIYVVMSDLALRDGRFTEAELALDKATAVLQGFTKSARRKQLLIPRVQANLAAVSEWREAWPKAEEHLAAWLKFDPQSAAAMQRMGRVLFAQGKREAALQQFQAAAQVDKTALNPDAMMGRLYEQSGERDKAQASMDAAVKAAPADLKTRLAMLQWAFETGQLAAAQGHADAALKIDPSSVEAKHVRGTVALFQRDFKVAEDCFQAVLIQAPASFAASNNLALALCCQDDESKKRRALEYAQVNVRQYPRQAEAYSTLGWILYQMGQRDEAEKALRTAASNSAVSPDTAYYLARVDIDRDRKAEAKVILESAVKATGPFMFRREAEDLLAQLIAAPVESKQPEASVETKKAATPVETKKAAASIETQKAAAPASSKRKPVASSK
ncbi:MAG: tetratricopeptide repeat protein [Pirellulaceae bacterium]